MDGSDAGVRSWAWGCKALAGVNSIKLVVEIHLPLGTQVYFWEVRSVSSSWGAGAESGNGRHNGLYLAIMLP